MNKGAGWGHAKQRHRVPCVSKNCITGWLACFNFVAYLVFIFCVCINHASLPWYLYPGLCIVNLAFILTHFPCSHVIYLCTESYACQEVCNGKYHVKGNISKELKDIKQHKMKFTNMCWRSVYRKKYVSSREPVCKMIGMLSIIITSTSYYGCC